jgi:hypothetical protein
MRLPARLRRFYILPAHRGYGVPGMDDHRCMVYVAGQSAAAIFSQTANAVFPNLRMPSETIESGQ